MRDVGALMEIICISVLCVLAAKPMACHGEGDVKLLKLINVFSLQLRLHTDIYPEQCCQIGSEFQTDLATLDGGGRGRRLRRGDEWGGERKER